MSRPLYVAVVDVLIVVAVVAVVTVVFVVAAGLITAVCCNWIGSML